MKYLFFILFVTLLFSCERDNSGQANDDSTSISDADQTVVNDTADSQETLDEEKDEVDVTDTDDIEPDAEVDETDDEIPDEEPVDYCQLDPQEFDSGVPSETDYELIEYDSNLFPMTVQAGSMESDKVILWGYTEDNIEKTLFVWREGLNPGEDIEIINEKVEPVDGYMKLKVEGLAPGTWYRYTFVHYEEDQPVKRSFIGNFKTAIHPECMETITITGTHGTNFKHDYTALRVSKSFNADFFIQLGDFAYNDGCESTEDFRNNWFKTLATTEYSEILPDMGQYIVWDDHEVEDNGDYEPSLKNDLDKVHRGLDAWFESMPVEQRDPAKVENNWGNPTYYRSFKWGKTLEMFMLDCRAERVPDSRSGSDPIYISKKQMEWFKNALLESTSHFKVVANSVPIAHYGGLWDFAVNDRWEGYEAQRTEILNFIVNNDIKNVVWLSGDFHTGSVAPVDDPDGAWGKMWEINMGPGGNTNPLGDMGKVPNFLWNTGKMNATVIVFDPFKNSVYVKYLDSDDESVMFEVELFGESEPLRNMLF
jgi:alkaline phosphatase D